MESILLTIEYIAFYIICGALLAIASGLMITILYELIWDRVLEGRIPTRVTPEEPTEGGATTKP